MKTHSLKRFFIALVATLALNLNAEKFKLASWNILSEVPYQKAFSQEESKPPLMDPLHRIELQKKYLSYLKQQNVDIICLQEVNLHPHRSDGEKIIEYLEEDLDYTVFFVDAQDIKRALSPMLDTIKTQLKQTPHAVLPNDNNIIETLANKALSQTTCIAYNSKKWVLTGKTPGTALLLWDISKLTLIKDITTGNITKIQPPQIKNIASASFQLKADKKAPELLITSLHLPFNVIETAETGDASTFLPMLQLEKTVKHRTNKHGFSIICGDFNWPTQIYTYPHQIQGKPYLDAQGKNYYDILTSHLNPLKWLNAAGNNFWPTILTHTGKLATFDYIFYTPEPLNKQGDPVPHSYYLTCKEFWQKPSIYAEYWGKLIKHGYIRTEGGWIPPIPANDVPYSNFPSDHVMLLAEFELEDISQQTADSASITKLGQALASMKY